MYNVGDLVIYGNTGVCTVTAITEQSMGEKESRLYYELKPYYQKASRILTPVNSTKIPIRPILNEEEAMALISEMPSIELLWIESDKMRETQYKECIRSADCRQWISIIKTLYQRRIERQRQGKRMTATDERYLRQAEDYLYSELSIPLNIPREEMETFISDTIKKQKASAAVNS